MTLLLGTAAIGLGNSRGVDIIIDPVAGPTIPDNVTLLAPCGILVLYGALGGKADELATMHRGAGDYPSSSTLVSQDTSGYSA